jgi:hypothetical protein
MPWFSFSSGTYDNVSRLVPRRWTRRATEKNFMTNDTTPVQLNEAIELLSQALKLVDANNCTLVAAHIQMALDAANQQIRATNT